MIKKKVLFLTSVPFYKASGSPLAIYLKVLAYIKLNFDVDIICYPHGEELNIEGLRIFRALPFKLFKQYLPGQFFKKIIYEPFIFIKAVQYLRKETYVSVIVVGSSVYSGLLLKNIFKNKYIAIEHGNLMTELNKWGIIKNNFIGLIARKFEIWVLNNYDFIFSEASLNIKPLIDNGLILCKLFIFIGGNPAKPILFKEKKTNRFIVAYTGTFVEVQNLNLLYQTAQLLIDQPIEFRFIGGSDDQVEIAQKNNYDSLNVRFYNRLPQTEFDEFISEADVVVSPRTFGDDGPQKIHDYLNYGKCILATNSLLHYELLNPEIACLVNPDPISFANHLLFLMEHPEICEQFAVRGKKHYDENLSFEIMLEKMRIAFDEKIYPSKS